MAMSAAESDPNLATYSDQSTVSFYENATGLMPPERVLLARYLKPGMDVLDIGVGGGRTTPFLAREARSYIGVDYAPAMVEACRRRFPEHAFDVADATAMPQFADASFDFTIFSFNGIDSIPSDAGRIAAMAEMRRVTRPGGIVMLSSHNARQLVSLPVYAGADLPRVFWRTLYSTGLSMRIAARNLTSRAFYRGEGWVSDPTHGGLHNFMSTPLTMARDGADAGMKLIEVASTFAPRKLPSFCENWYTYVFRPG